MQPTRDTDPTRRTVRGVGVALSVVEVGPPDAPAAVVAHGVGSSARFVVDAFGAAAGAAGYRLVAYDLRGHGKSAPARDAADHTLGAHVADLAAVAGAVGARVVGGVSLGGHAAAELVAGVEAGDGPEGAAAVGDGGFEGLIVCLPAWTGRAEPGQGPHAAVADEIRQVGVDRALERATSDAAVAGWLAELLVRDWSAADPASLAAALLALDGGRAPDETALRSIDLPCGLVAWPQDPGHPIDVARAWRRWIPRAALETVTMDEVGQRVGELGAAAFRALTGAQQASPASRR